MLESTFIERKKDLNAIELNIRKDWKTGYFLYPGEFVDGESVIRISKIVFNVNKNIEGQQGFYIAINGIDW